MTRIRKAVVAVAGSGTRFLPVTKAMPKEMLPIVDKPIIQLVAEEIVEAGIQDVIFVTKWDKRPLEDHFDPNWALTHELQKAGKDHLLDDIDHLCEQANFSRGLFSSWSTHDWSARGSQRRNTAIRNCQIA